MLTNATPGAGSVGTPSLQGTWLYGSSSGQGLLALDVSDSRAPRSVSTGLRAGFLTGVAALGDRVALAGSSPELTVVNVSRPDTFPVVGRWGSLSGSASATALGPGHAYLAVNGPIMVADGHRAFLGSFGRLDRVDLTQPDSPRSVARHEGADAFRAVALSGEHLYAATQVPDRICFDMAGETNLLILGRQDLPGIVNWMAVDGTRLLLSGGSPQWLQIRSLDDSIRPVLLGCVSDLPPFQSAVLRPPHLYPTA